MSDEIEREVVTNPDGSTTVKTSFSLSGDNLRPINDDVVEALDNRLEGVGSNLLHMIDPARMMDFGAGGPAVWSVGVVEVGGEQPHTLLLTYGFSEVVSPSALREGLDYEYSIAVPAGQPVEPWAGALLRHLSRYVLSSGRALEVGQIMPCHAPITWIPFPPEHHEGLPGTHLDAIVVADDPLLGSIETPRGAIAVRRFVGITPEERERVEVWSAGGFVEELARVNAGLLTDLERSSIFDDTEVAKRCDERADKEGSEVPAFMAQVAWSVEDDDLILSFSDGATAMKVANGVRRRLAFGNTCLVISPDGFEIGFEPTDEPFMQNDGAALYIGGRVDSEPLSGILEMLVSEAESVEPLHIAIPIG